MIYLALIGLATLALRNGWSAFHTFQQYRAQFTLQATFRTVGIWGLLVSTGSMILLFSAKNEFGLWHDKSRIVETVIPLIMGIQAAVLFSPADENALEILLTYPRPVAWILAERLGLALLFQTVAVLVGILISFSLFDDHMLGLALIRWLSPTILLMGIGVYTTLKSRVLSFGVAVTGVVWVIGLLFGPLLLPSMQVISLLHYPQPYLWAIHPFLQPNDLGWHDYWVNRTLIALIGWFLISRAVTYLRDEETVLLGTTSKQNIRSTGSGMVEGL